jgi:hypothetical protein
MMLKWLDAREAQAFAKELAAFYAEKIPLESTLGSKKFATKTQDTLKKMSQRIHQFKQAQPLNFYKKAKLLNTFKWALRDAGYDSAYIDEMASWMTLQL